MSGAGNARHLSHLGGDAGVLCFVVGVVEHTQDPGGDAAHLVGAEAARRQRRRADAHAAADRQSPALPHCSYCLNVIVPVSWSIT
jgi:hypothetical protein